LFLTQGRKAAKTQGKKISREQIRKNSDVFYFIPIILSIMFEFSFASLHLCAFALKFFSNR